MKKHLPAILILCTCLLIGGLSAYVGLIYCHGIADVTQYGATGNGATDDTVAVQLAIDSYLPVYFPPGKYKLGQLIITNSVKIYGAGSNFESTNATVIWPNSSTSTVFSVNTHGPVTFKDLAIVGNLFPAYGGSGIQLDDVGASGTANQFTLIENVVFDNLFKGVNIVRASSWSILSCPFWNIPSNGVGIACDNQFNKDQGDGTVSHCTFATQGAVGGTNAVCISWQGGGGDRFSDNKFLNSPALSANLGVITSNATAQIYFTGNSVDGILSPQPGVNLFNNTSGTNFFGISIAANQFIAGGTFNGWMFITGNPSGTVQNVSVTGNDFFCYGASMIGNGGLIFQNVTNVTLSGNVIIGGGIGIGGGTGVFFTASGSGIVGMNTITNFFKNIVTNSSPNLILGPNSN